MPRRFTTTRSAYDTVEPGPIFHERWTQSSPRGFPDRIHGINRVLCQTGPHPILLILFMLSGILNLDPEGLANQLAAESQAGRMDPRPFAAHQGWMLDLSPGSGAVSRVLLVVARLRAPGGSLSDWISHPVCKLLVVNGWKGGRVV